MGAWGTGNFDNDIACDWVYELENNSDLSIIKNAIYAVFEEEYVDADVASEALAAIDTLVRLTGKFSVKNVYTESVDRWVATNNIEPSKALIEKSSKALQRILGKSSELLELWEETEDFHSWEKELKWLASNLR